MKQLILAVVALLAGACLAGCGPAEQEPAMDMAVVKADLETVSQARILFAHQSVGRNVIEGVQSLAQQTGVKLRIQDVSRQASEPGPGLFHMQVGVNGDPQTKVEAFDRLLTDASQPGYDAALLKFCYGDMAGDSKSRGGLLERYSSMVTHVTSARPGLRLVHVTVPLRSDPPGWKTRLKRLLGRSTDEDADNVLRNAYNKSLSTRFATSPIFDIARIESTESDGRRTGFARDNDTVYALAPEYSADGGHLNEQGQRVAAAGFLHALAQALRQGR